FGYVEFATLDGLKKALELNETSFQSRNIRISIAEPQKDREGQRDISDWSRKGPLPDLPQSQRRPSERNFERGGSSRNYDTASDAGSDRGGDRRRPGFFEGDGKVRDFGNWERKGPLSPVPPNGPMREGMREGGRQRAGDVPRERRQSPAWGEARSEAGSRPPRREFQERTPVERAPTAADMDNQWRTKMRPDAPSPVPTPEASTPSSPIVSAPPTSRPKLNLAKRTISESQPVSETTTTSDSKASPFGAARPIDTAAREKEIEEKRELAVREKKEADEKAREEKRLAKEKEDAARAEKAASAPKEANREAVKANGQDSTKSPKENGAASPAPAKKYEILSRANGGEDDAEDGAVDESANGEIVGDKETKPQEIVREVPKDDQDAAQGAESTAQAMEDDGWSTVSAKSKFGRKGGQRALAS
ncbi:hypothetical protein LTR28_004703, partial [Elasticomyces elasticus]